MQSKLHGHNDDRPTFGSAAPCKQTQMNPNLKTFGIIKRGIVLHKSPFPLNLGLITVILRCT